MTLDVPSNLGKQNLNNNNPSEHQDSSCNKKEGKILNLNLVNNDNYNNITYKLNSNISYNKNEDISNLILNFTKNIHENIKSAKQDFDNFLWQTDIQGQKHKPIIFDKILDRKIIHNTKIETDIPTNTKIEKETSTKTKGETETPIELNLGTTDTHNKETET